MATERDFRIVFEEDGYPRELINSLDRERAVREGALTSDMEVTVYRADAPPGVFKVGDIEEMKSLFGPKEPAASPPAEPARPAPAPPPPSPSSFAAADAVSIPAKASPPPGKGEGFWGRNSVADSGAGAVTGRSAGATSRAPAVAAAEPAGEEEVAPVPPSSEPGKYTFLWVLLGIMIVLYLLGTCSTQTRKVDADTSVRPANDALLGNDVSAVGPVEETGPAEVTSAELASSQTRYAVRETNVRRRPTTASPMVGKLDRGASVMGVMVPGVDPEHRWFKITSGEFTGYFVSADANVSDTARPSLDTSFAGGKAVYHYAPLYAEPDRSARILEYAKPGTTLNVVGAVSNGLAEVSLRSGAIAYVDQAAFEAVADPQENFDEGSTEASSKDSTSLPRFVDHSRPAALQNRDFISASDYPAKSLRENDTGTVGFRVEVTATGFPGKCRVTRSSGHERLDRATCRLVMERARFDPARDVTGEPMAGLYEGSFTWRLD